MQHNLGLTRNHNNPMFSCQPIDGRVYARTVAWRSDSYDRINKQRQQLRRKQANEIKKHCVFHPKLETRKYNENLEKQGLLPSESITVRASGYQMIKVANVQKLKQQLQTKELQQCSFKPALTHRPAQDP